MHKVELVRPDELGADDLRLWADWRRADADLVSPYFSPLWPSAVARVRSDVRIAVFLKDNGRTTGFLPVQRPSRHVLQAAGGPLCDYQGAIGAADQMPGIQALLEATGAGRYDFANLLAKQPVFARHAREVHVSRVINLEGGYETYQQKRRASGSSENKRARKRARKLEREAGPLCLQTHCREEALFEQLIGWKRAQYRRTGQTDIFTRPWALDLVRNLFAQNDADLHAELFALHAGDQLAALNLCLRSGPVLHCWFIAHEPALSHFSPGLILFEKMIEHLSNAGMHELDLGAGDYRFKRNLANAARPLCGGFAGNGTLSARLRAWQYDLRSLIETLPLGPVSAWPGKAMRRHDLHLGLRASPHF